MAEVEAKAEEQAEVEADKDGHRHEPFEPLQWPGVLPRPPSAAEALSDFVMRGAHPDEEASSDPAWPDGAWLARTPDGLNSAAKPCGRAVGCNDCTTTLVG